MRLADVARIIAPFAVGYLVSRATGGIPVWLAAVVLGLGVALILVARRSR